MGWTGRLLTEMKENTLPPDEGTHAALNECRTSSVLSGGGGSYFDDVVWLLRGRRSQASYQTTLEIPDSTEACTRVYVASSRHRRSGPAGHSLWQNKALPLFSHEYPLLMAQPWHKHYSLMCEM